jgi:hypothetical protein
MVQTVTLQLPDETLQRYRQGATAARKLLEEFLIERLVEAVPPLADDLPSPVREELQALEQCDDDTLWQVARSQLSPARQRQYSRLLAKNTQGTITAQEKAILRTLGEQARLLTLKIAHAYLLLKWRGYRVPSPEELQSPG